METMTQAESSTAMAEPVEIPKSGTESYAEHARDVTLAARLRGEQVDAWYLADGKWRGGPPKRTADAAFSGPAQTEEEKLKEFKEFYISALENADIISPQNAQNAQQMQQMMQHPQQMQQQFAQMQA